MSIIVSPDCRRRLRKRRFQNVIETANRGWFIHVSEIVPPAAQSSHSRCAAPQNQDCSTVFENEQLNPRKTSSATSTPQRLLASMRSNVIWAFFGNGCYLSCQYLMLMAMAKLGDPTIVGQYALALAICSPVIIGSQMQLRQVQVTDVRGEYHFGTYIGLRAICTLLALLLIGGIAFSGNYSVAMARLILLMGVAKGFESLSDAAYGRLQRSERMDVIAISLASKGILSAVVFIGLLWGMGDLLWPMTGLTLVWGAVLAGYDFPMAARLAGTERSQSISISNWQALGSLFISAVPLGLTTGLQSFSSNLPRYFLEAYHGQQAVALFAVASAPLSLLGLFNGAISQATMGRAATHFQEGNLSAFQRLNRQIMVVPVLMGCVFTCLFALWGETLLELLFTSEYRAAAPLLVIMSAGLALGSLTSLGSTVLNAARAYKLQLLVIVLVLVLQIPLCMYLIPEYAEFGAGWTECIRHGLFVLIFSIAGKSILSRTTSRLESEEYGQSAAA